MTSPKHNRCTDRIAEAVKDIDCDIVVNIQGDEPLLYPEIIDMVVEPFSKDKSIVSVNPIAKIIREKLSQFGTSLFFKSEKLAKIIQINARTDKIIGISLYKKARTKQTILIEKRVAELNK